VDDRRFGKVADKTVDLHVPGFADDHREISEIDKQTELLMRMADEGARSVGQPASTETPCSAHGVARAMRGDHDLLGLSGSIETAFTDASIREAFTDDRIVDELTENRERTILGEACGFGNGVADAKTEAVVIG
jgi:hypothetical protein